MKKHARSNTTLSQSTLDVFSKTSLLHGLNNNQINIINHLISGYYPAMIARKLNLSRSYLSRFVNKLLDLKLITPAYKDPMFRRAMVYNVGKELSDYVKSLDYRDESSLTLLTPHNIRYKRKIIKKEGKSIATDTQRFAHAKFKHIRSFTPRGGTRHVYEMQSPHGRIRAIVHPTASIEMFCVDRHYIPAKSVDDATAILAMALNDAYTRFVSEQGWCGCRLELGDPVAVGSVHYAFKSAELKKIVEKDGTQKKIAGFELDKSPESAGNTRHVEFETQDGDEADRFDKTLRMVPTVRNEIRSVQEAILGINNAVGKIDQTYNNVQALCQSGLPLQNQFNQITAIVSSQGQSITMMQETMLELVKNMGKILDKMNIQ